MSAGIPSRPYWYAFTIIVVSLCIAISIWKVHTSVRTTKLETCSDVHPTIQIVPRELHADPDAIPALLPGDTCETAERTLGKPTEKDEFYRMWKTHNFVVTVTTSPDCHLTGISISVLSGHKALTADGVRLGDSTLADVEKLPGKPLAGRSESVEAAEGHWVGRLQFDPAPEMPFTAAYSAPLADGKAETMDHDPVISDFRDVPITQYSVDLIDPKRRSR